MSKSTSSPNRGFLHSLTLPVGGLVLGVVILLICLIFSVTLGAADIPWTIVSQRTLEEIRFWLAGSLAGADANIITQVYWTSTLCHCYQ
jgi:ABC-type Fe3+-siderophore transport system permease subunit